jgi:photosystem II stability/assembly factor-like uncharacterized protein
MRTLLVSLLRRKSICLALVAVLSCDSFKEEFNQPDNEVTFSQAEFYLVPGSSVVIDLQSVIKQSLTNAVIEFSHPGHGLLSQLDAMLLEYTPNIKFLEGKDSFVLSAYKDGTLLKAQTVSLVMKSNKEQFPCDLFAIGDKVRAKVASPVSIKFLSNDLVCGMNISDMLVSIHSHPAFGSATVVGDSIIRYVPQAMYEGKDMLVYKLASLSGDGISFGVVRITVDAAVTGDDDQEIRLLAIPGGRSLHSMFFVNENTGFLGGDGIYKTIDGGVTWSRLTHPQPSANLAITELFFLNTEEGFASFSMCPSLPGGCNGGLLHTTDGGDHWELTLYDYPVNSVFFSSSSIGYITLSTYFDEDYVIDYIHKTEDGGKSWKEVFTTTLGLGTLKLRYANSVTAYAYGAALIFKTSNGGKSWEKSAGADFIASFAVASEAIAYANMSYGWDLTSPSSLMRTHDGFTWDPVASFQYLILQLAFSPSGKEGIAIGISGDNSRAEPLTVTINTSTDKGATWNEERRVDELYGFPGPTSFPSEKVAYILCSEQIIKFSRL